MKLKVCVSVAALSLSGLMPAYAENNVAIGGLVTFDGPGFGNYSSTWGAGSLANAQSLTDGVFLPTNQQWNLGTVFWNGNVGGDPYNFVTVQLNQLANVSSLTLQADNNDDYGIEYRNNQGNWVSLISLVPPRSWGLETTHQILSSPISTDAFRIRSVGGDGYYSVSEFQALGTVPAVPEPETYALLLAGLGLISAAVNRRKAKQA